MHSSTVSIFKLIQILIIQFNSKANDSNLIDASIFLFHAIQILFKYF